MLSEVSQRKTNAVQYHLYVEAEEYIKLMNTTKKKQTHRYRDQTSGYQWGGAIQWWRSGRYKLLGIRQAQGCVVRIGNIANIL